MGLAKLRRFDVQARVACVLALVSVLPCAAAVVLLMRNYHHELGQIVYSAESSFVLVFFGCTLVSLVPASIGFFLGLSSAGQRRNDKPKRSWIGFFLGGLVTTFNLILLLAFLMLRFQQPVR